MERAIARLLFSLPDVAVLGTDERRRITSYSPGLIDLIGAKVPSRLSELFTAVPLFFETPDGEVRVPRAQRPTEVAQNGALVRDRVLVAYPPDGSRRYLRFNAAPRRSSGGRIAGTITLIQDVTAEHLRSNTEKSLRDLLIDTVNHGLRTPLSLVIGHAELLDDMDLSLPPEATRSMEALVDGARRLNDLTRRVTELVDLASAGQNHFATVDLAAQVRAEVETLRPLAGRRHVRLHRTVPRTVLATVDAHLLVRALSELVRNAINHAPAASTVSVTLLEEDDWVSLVVEDAGPGIPAEEVDRLSRPFEHGGREVSSSGRGLGLALARVTATAHGGAIDLQPREPSGLRATIRVPRNANLSAGPARQRVPAAQTLPAALGSAAASDVS